MREADLRYRVDRFMALGFELHDAEQLARATTTHRDSKGRTWDLPVAAYKVRRALDAGCTHELAVLIFT